MFGSQETAVVDLKPGEMCKLLKFCPIRVGRKEVVSGGFVLVILGLGAGKKKTNWKL